MIRFNIEVYHTTIKTKHEINLCRTVNMSLGHISVTTQWTEWHIASICGRTNNVAPKGGKNNNMNVHKKIKHGLSW